MQSKQNVVLKEGKHVSKNRPYSLHRTIVEKEVDPVLYLHWHDEYEFLYLEKGVATFVIEDQNYELHEGEAIFIPANLLHMAKRVNNEECCFYALVFHPILLTEAYSNSTYYRFVQPMMQNGLPFVTPITSETLWETEILVALKKIFLCIDEEIGDWELFFHGSLYIIWHFLYTHHLSQITLSHNYENLSSKLSESIQWIHSNYHQEITLEELALKSHLSTGAFCRYFKQLTGFTAFSYLTRYRIIRSCELLTQTHHKVAYIASLCGFNNISHFNREFLKYMKVTPTEYRNRQ